MTDEMMEQRAEKYEMVFGEAIEGFLDKEQPHIELKRRGKPDEVAAKVIFSVASKGNNEREVFVGYPTTETILGNKVLPGWLDHHLAETAYDGQQTEQREKPNRRNNLWKPLDGNHGAHGDFDAQAWDFSPKLWTTTHPWIIWTGMAAIGLAVGWLFKKKPNPNR